MAGCTSRFLPIVSRVRGEHGRVYSLAARGSDHRQRTSHIHDPTARAPASAGAAAATGTVLGDLCLLCSGHALQCRHHSLAVARVCLDGPAGTLSRAGVGRRLCPDLSDASASGGNSPACARNFSGRSQPQLSGLVVILMTAWSCASTAVDFEGKSLEV